MDRFSQLALSAARMAEADSGISIAAAAGARRSGRRDGDRRAVRVRELLPDPPRARPGPDEPLRDRPDHPEHGGRLGLDGARRAGAARCGMHGLRGVEHGNRRRSRRDPPRPRRRHVLRRDGGADHARRHSGLHRDASTLTPERRPEGCVTAVRLWPRRVRYGRGCGNARARGARARTRARRQDLRGGAGLRRLVRREPRLRSGSDGGESGSRDEDGVLRRRDRARGRGVRERSRDVDAVRRLRARRACSSSRSARRRRTGRPSPRRRAPRGTAWALQERSRRSSRRSR